MEQKKLKTDEQVKYLRIPPWSEIRCSPCPPRDGDYEVHVKVREHRKRGSPKVRGLLFECDRELPVGTHVEMEIILSEDAEIFRGYGDVIEVHRVGEKGPFRIKIDFKAASDEEAVMIARFAGKFC